MSTMLDTTTVRSALKEDIGKFESEIDEMLADAAYADPGYQLFLRLLQTTLPSARTTFLPIFEQAAYGDTVRHLPPLIDKNGLEIIHIDPSSVVLVNGQDAFEARLSETYEHAMQQLEKALPPLGTETTEKLMIQYEESIYPVAAQMVGDALVQYYFTPRQVK